MGARASRDAAHAEAAGAAGGSGVFSSTLDAFRLEQEEVATLSKLSGLSPSTVEGLWALFRDLSALRVADDLVDPEEFAHALGVERPNLLLRRIFDRINVTRTQNMTFREFLKGVAVLAPGAPREDKIRFSFSIYDANEDNTIDVGEMRQLLTSALDLSEIRLSPAQVEEMCDRTLRDVDENSNGVIDYEEYVMIVERNPRLLAPFTLDLDRLLAARQRAHAQPPPLPASHQPQPASRNHQQRPSPAKSPAPPAAAAAAAGASEDEGKLLGAAPPPSSAAVAAPGVQKRLVKARMRVDSATESGDPAPGMCMAFTCTGRRSPPAERVVKVADVNDLFK
jgi:Ca2+-binding EF-hand superfamily protein